MQLANPTCDATSNNVWILSRPGMSCHPGRTSIPGTPPPVVAATVGGDDDAARAGTLDPPTANSNAAPAIATNRRPRRHRRRTHLNTPLPAIAHLRT
jgi:hypothetical protein